MGGAMAEEEKTIPWDRYAGLAIASCSLALASFMGYWNVQKGGTMTWVSVALLCASAAFLIGGLVLATGATRRYRAESHRLSYSKRYLIRFLDEERPSGLTAYPYGRLIQFKARRKIKAPFVLSVKMDQPVSNGRALLVFAGEREEAETSPIKRNRIEFGFSIAADKGALLTVIVSSERPVETREATIKPRTKLASLP